MDYTFSIVYDVANGSKLESAQILPLAAALRLHLFKTDRKLHHPLSEFNRRNITQVILELSVVENGLQSMHLN